MKKYIISEYIDKKEVSRKEVELSDYKFKKLKKESYFLYYSNDFKGYYLKINYYNEYTKTFNRLIELNKITKYVYNNIEFFKEKYTSFDIQLYINKVKKEYKTLITSKIHLTEFILDIGRRIENIKQYAKEF